MTRAAKLQEIKELKDYLQATPLVINEPAFLGRIQWLENNLDSKQSKEAKRMARENRASKSSKTLSFNL